MMSENDKQMGERVLALDALIKKQWKKKEKVLQQRKMKELFKEKFMHAKKWADCTCNSI